MDSRLSLLIVWCGRALVSFVSERTDNRVGPRKISRTMLKKPKQIMISYAGSVELL